MAASAVSCVHHSWGVHRRKSKLRKVRKKVSYWWEMPGALNTKLESTELAQLLVSKECL